MKKLFVAFILFLTGIMLVSCGQKVGSDGKTRVTMWIMPNSQEPVNDLRAVLKPFEDANPDIIVEVTSLDWGSAWQKITTAATSADTPDICQLGTTWVGSISSMGAMANLNEKIEAIGGSDLFVPSAWDTSAIIGSGEITAIPWIVDTRAIFYRTDVFQKLGLTADDIRTWERFKATLHKIKEANLVINNKTVEPLGITGKNDWNVIHNIAPWIWSAGGRFIDKTNRKSVINSEQAVDGLTFYTSLVKEGLVPLQCLEQNSSQVSTAFNNGFYAMYVDGPYALKTLTTPPERGGSSDSPVARNFAIAPYPSGPMGRSTFCGGSALAIFKASKKKEAAWKVVEYLTTNTDAQISYSRVTGFLPAKTEAFNVPYYQNDPFRKVFSDSVSFSRAYPCIAAWGPIETVVLTRRFGLMWDEIIKNLETFSKKDIKRHLDKAASEMDVILEQQ